VIEQKLKQPVLNLSENTKGHDYYVGDLHGHYPSFVRGLDAINFNPEIDRIICVGDLIDRGPDSLACLRLVHENWYYCVIGNHERTFYHTTKDSNAKRNLENGWQFRLSDDEREECIGLVETMHWAITVAHGSESIGIVHADIPDNMSWNAFCHQLCKQDSWLIDYATWSRKRVNDSLGNVPGIKWLFVGHSCQEVPRQFGNVIYIDTGVYIPGRYCSTYGLTFASISGGHLNYLTVYNKK